jgi:hypothetical protein
MQADDAAMQAYMGNGKKLFAHFFMEAVPDSEESVKQGRPIYKEEEFIRIMVPGDQLNVTVREVREIDKDTYPEQYTAFKRRQEQPLVGTPLDKIPFLSKARVLEFHALGLKTAEHVRDMSDAVAQKFMDAHGLRKRIGDFLQAASDGAPAEKLQAELAKRDETIATLKAALESQGEKIDQLTKSQRR